MNRLQIISIVVTSLFATFIIILFALKKDMDNDKEYNQFKEDMFIKTLVCLGIFIFFLVLIISSQKRHDNLCQPYIGKTIIKKQLPDLLIFKDDKWLKTSSAEQQWFESKVVGDTLKKEECEKVVFDPALF